MNNKMEEFVTSRVVLTTETEDFGYSGLGFGFVSEEAFDECEWDTIELGYPKAEGAPVAITVFEDIIASIKEAGGTHMAVDYHCDHGSYLVDGYDVHTSTEEEIRTHLGDEEAEEREELLAYKTKLETELKTINGKLND